MTTTGFSGGVMLATNVNFSGAVTPAVTTDGQLLIGSTTLPNIKVGSLTSTGGTITITPGSGTINLDLSGGSVGVDSVQVQAFTAPGTNPVLPTGAGLLTINGAAVAAAGIPVRSDSIAVNALQIEVQRASASVATDTTSQGLASFNSAQFIADGNGFVSLVSAPVTWLESAGGALLVNTGYFANAAAAYTLPAAPAIGQIVEIIDNIGGGVVVTANAGQTIRLQNTISSVAGTATSSQFGDALRLVYRAANTQWQCAPAMGGNWLTA